MNHPDTNIGSLVNNPSTGHLPYSGHSHPERSIEIVLSWWYLPDHFVPYNQKEDGSGGATYSYDLNSGLYIVAVAPRERGMGEVTSILSTNPQERYYSIGKLVIPLAQGGRLPDKYGRVIVESVGMMELQKHPIPTNHWWDNITAVYGAHISDESIQKFNVAHR